MANKLLFFLTLPSSTILKYEAKYKKNAEPYTILKKKSPKNLSKEKLNPKNMVHI